MTTAHLIIQGKVQGVFYRASAKKTADSLRIKGWVKNAHDGHVEAMASGTEEAVNQFINWCKQGPPRAKVTNVTITRKEEAFVPEGFEIR